MLPASLRMFAGIAFSVASRDSVPCVETESALAWHTHGRARRIAPWKEEGVIVRPETSIERDDSEKELSDAGKVYVLRRWRKGQ